MGIEDFQYLFCYIRARSAELCIYSLLPTLEDPSTMDSLTDSKVVVQIISARDLKNNNFDREILKPYVAVYVDPKTQVITCIDNEGNTLPVWNETVVVPFTTRIDDAYLHFDVYTKDEKGVKIGSARIALKGIVDDVGIGEKSNRTLLLKCPSGPPQGTIDVNLLVRSDGAPSLARPTVVSQTPQAVPPPPHGYPWAAPPPYGYTWAVPPPYGYPSAVRYDANMYLTSYPQAPAPYTAATPPLMGYQYTTSPSPYGSGQAGGPAGRGLLNHLIVANTFHQFASNFLGGLGLDGPEGSGDTSTGY